MTKNDLKGLEMTKYKKNIDGLMDGLTDGMTDGRMDGQSAL